MYDVVIVGCGPAGMTAGIYLARAGKKVAILEKESIGGQISTSPLVENYPGFSKISGSELSNNMYEQAVNSGVEIIVDEAVKITKDKVITEENEYNAKVIIVATGAKYRKLNIEKEEQFIGRGIHFCTACDGMFYRNKKVAVIGGANSAVVNALYLSDLCEKVYLIYRRDKLRCESVLNERINSKSNVEILYNSVVSEILGDDEFDGIVVECNGEKNKIDIDGMFMSIGLVPETSLCKDILDVDEENYFIHDNTRTKYENIFVIGDCIKKDVRQVATAVNDGAVAATYVIDYLNKK